MVLSLIFMGLYILLRFRNWAFSLGAFASVATTTLLIVASYILLLSLIHIFPLQGAKVALHG